MSQFFTSWKKVSKYKVKREKINDIPYSTSGLFGIISLTKDSLYHDLYPNQKYNLICYACKIHPRDTRCWYGIIIFDRISPTHTLFTQNVYDLLYIIPLWMLPPWIFLAYMSNREKSPTPWMESFSKHLKDSKRPCKGTSRVYKHNTTKNTQCRSNLAHVPISKVKRVYHTHMIL